jgi:threonine dehydratase
VTLDLTPTLDQVKAAQQRIAPYLRHSPLIPAIALKQAIPGCPDLRLKLDCLQVTGSFKALEAAPTLANTLALRPTEPLNFDK